MVVLAKQKFSNSAIQDTVTAVRATGGKIVALHVYNPNSSASYLQVFNVEAASVSLGSTTAHLYFGMPANGGLTMHLDGVAFDTAISVAGTTTPTGSTGVTTGLVVTIIHET